jgi:hypothetical protein
MDCCVYILVCIYKRGIRIEPKCLVTRHRGAKGLSRETMQYNIRPLKGTLTREFCLWFFSSEHVPQPTDSYPNAVSNINSNSLKNSNLQSILRCGPPRKIGLLLQATADLKPECYNPCVVLFHHTYILHRLSL